MNKLLLSLLALIAILFNVQAQNVYTSKNNNTGNWTTASIWTKSQAWMTNPPPSTSLAGSDIVNVYGYVTRSGNLNVSGDATINIYDTLVITGNLTMSQLSSGTGIKVQAGGLLIVLGDFSTSNSNGNMISVASTGRVAILGEYNQQQGSTTTTGPFYVFDNTPTFNWGATVDGVAYNNNTATLASKYENENNLLQNDKPLANFIQSLSGINIVCSATPTFQTTTGAGTWTTSGDWVSNNKPGYTLTSGSYTIPAGDIVTIESGNFTLSNTSLIVYGTLIVNGTLVMSTGKIIDIKSGGSVTCCQNCNNSNKIKIGSTTAWTGNNGTISGPSVISETGILPVELLFLKASAGKTSVEITWATATEKNFDKFFIERSANGQDFETIGEQKGTGNSLSRQDYSFEDHSPVQGKNYYRLRSVDLDQYTEYSYITVAEYTGDKLVSVYPNPNDGLAINVQLNFAPSEDAHIQIFDNVGANLYNSSIVETQSVLNFTSALKPGVYLLKYISTSHNQVIRFSVK
jgi:hypothetical protein